MMPCLIHAQQHEALFMLKGDAKVSLGAGEFNMKRGTIQNLRIRFQANDFIKYSGRSGYPMLQLKVVGQSDQGNTLSELVSMSF